MQTQTGQYIFNFGRWLQQINSNIKIVFTHAKNLIMSFFMDLGNQLLLAEEFPMIAAG